MRRVAVVGNPGSGKSTVSAALARTLGVPWIELDALYHLPDWGKPEDEGFRRKVAEALDGDGWVADGNYSVVQDLAWARADTVVWLDLPRRVVMTRLVRRTASRVVRGTELWSGNREHLRDMVSFDEQRNIVLWSWNRFPVYRRRYAAKMAERATQSPSFVRLCGAGEVRCFLAGDPKGEVP
jgi:adenylate kinase family enzyme